MQTLKIFLLVFIISINLTAQWIKTCPSSSVNCIEISGSTVYIGTDNSVVGGDADGVLKSEDNAIIWQIINNGLIDKSIHALEAVGTNLFVGTFDGIFKSTDDGESWIPKNIGLPIINITALAAFDDSTLFTAVRDYYSFGLYKSTNLGDHWDCVLGGFPINTIAVNGLNIFLGTYNGIFRSTDGGLSWSGVNGPSSIVNSFTFSDSTTFAGSYFGVYRSTNNGDTWEILSAGPNTNIMALTAYEQKIIAGTYDQGIFISTDLGNTWISMNQGLIDKHILSLAIKDSIIFAGTNIGMFRMTDLNASWTPCNFTPYSIAFLKTTLNSTFTGGYFSMCRSTDDGMSWFNYSSDCLQQSSTKDLISLNNELFVSLFNNSVCKSTDNGTNWSPVSNWPSGYSANSFAVKDEKLFAATSPPNVFRSTDGGINWYSVNNGLGDENIFRIIVKDDNLFLTTREVVFFSSNDGNTWSQRNNGIQYLDAKEIAVIDSTIFLPSGDGMYYSTNDGLNWILKEWPNYSPNCSYLFPFENILFWGTHGEGIFMSSDFGDSWVRIDDSLPAGYTISALTTSGDYLLAGTIGAGIWRRPLSQIITNINDEKNITPSEFILSQNYPNPFNPSTTIKYQIPEISFVTIKVYDALGNEMITLVNEEKPIGSYEVEFSVGLDSSPDIATGTYFYRIQAGAFVETKKMMLLK